MWVIVTKDTAEWLVGAASLEEPCVMLMMPESLKSFSRK